MCIIPGNFGAQQGWQCPVCKRVLAPFMVMCPCAGQEQRTETTTGTKLEPRKEVKPNAGKPRS